MSQRVTRVGVLITLLLLPLPGQAQLRVLPRDAIQPQPPAIRAVTPLQGTQGTTVSLTITGANFGPGASVQFTPPTGLQVLSTTVLSPTQLQAQVGIDAAAPPGPRQLVVTLGALAGAAPSPFTVVPAQAPPPGIISVPAPPLPAIGVPRSPEPIPSRDERVFPRPRRDRAPEPTPIPTPPPIISPSADTLTTTPTLVSQSHTFLKIFDKYGAENIRIWSTELTHYGSWKGYVKPFNWTTDLKNVDSAIWQISVLPFPQSAQLASGKAGLPEKDPLSPPGLVAKGEVSYVKNCYFCFETDFYPFSPGAKEAEKSPTAWLKTEPITPKITLTTPTYKPTDYLMFEKAVPPFTYYIRVIPRYKGKIAGAPSNTVYLHWAEKNIESDKNLELFKKCAVTPTPVECQSYKPPPSPYKVEILSYSPPVSPNDELRGCFQATQDIYGPPPLADKAIFYHQGDLICPPKPEKKSDIEQAWEYFKKAVSSYSFMWDAAKKAIVSFVADLACPEEIKDACKAGLGAALDYGLVAMGLPPSIPDFDALVKEGGSYFVGELAKQIGTPEVVVELTKKAEVLKKTVPEFVSMSVENIVNNQLEKMAKQSLDEAGKAFNLAQAQSSGYVPSYAAPFVVPYPDGWPKGPKIVIKITRKSDVPDKYDYCTGSQGGFYNKSVDVTVDADSSKAADWGNASKGKLYENISVPRPKLSLGESKTITLGLEPYFVKQLIIDGIAQDNKTIDKKMGSFKTLYSGGTAHFFLYGGCTEGETLDWPADKFYP